MKEVVGMNKTEVSLKLKRIEEILVERFKLSLDPNFNVDEDFDLQSELQEIIVLILPALIHLIK